MPETRRIENFGIMKLLPEERGANNLLITSDVIQLPYSEYLSVKTNPPKSHYGYVAFMSGEYVLYVLDIQFRRQIILDRDRYIVQLAWQESCNSATIRNVLGVPLPDTEVDYPIWICDELRFRLEPGVIISVFKSHVPPVTCPGTLVVEPDMIPNPPDIPSAPQTPPPPSVPDSAKIPLSPPYEGANDNGNTYVRTGSCANYNLTGEYRFADTNGTPGGSFEISFSADPDGFVIAGGLSTGEVYFKYTPCGGGELVYVTNGFGGIKPGYTLTLVE